MARAASEAHSGGHLSFGAAAGVVLVLVIVVILAIITDLSCYFVNRCGVTMCICRSLGRSPGGTMSGSQSREKAVEEGERSVTNLVVSETVAYMHGRIGHRKFNARHYRVFITPKQHTRQ